MKRSVLLGLLALVVLAVAWGFGRLAPDESVPVRPRPAARRAPSTVTRAAEPPAAAPASDVEPARLRDLFAYADEPEAFPPARVTLLPTPTPGAAVATPAPPPAVRVVGLVRRAGELRVALSERGQVVVVALGDSVGGRRVIAIDEDRGVCLRATDGREEWLPLER